MTLNEEQMRQLKMRSELRLRSQERLRHRGQVVAEGVPRGTEADDKGKGFLTGLKGFMKVDVPRMGGGLSQYIATVNEVLQLKKAEREANPNLYKSGVEIGRVPPEPEIEIAQLVENLQKNKLYQIGHQMLEKSERTLLEHPELASTPVTFKNFYKPSLLAEQLARNLPQAGAAAAIPIGITALTKSPMAGMMAGFTLIYGMEAGSAYSDAIDAGLDTKTASEVAHRTGLINAVVEQTSVMPLLKTLGLGKAASKELTGIITKELIKRGGIGTIGKSTAEQFVTEGMEEVVQELNSIVQLEQHIPAEKRSKPKDIINRLFQAFYGGATAGGVIGFTAGAGSVGARAVGERAELRTLREQYEAGKKARGKIEEEERAVEPEKKWVETPGWRVEEEGKGEKGRKLEREFNVGDKVNLNDEEFDVVGYKRGKVKVSKQTESGVKEVIVKPDLLTKIEEPTETAELGLGEVEDGIFKNIHLVYAYRQPVPGKEPNVMFNLTRDIPGHPKGSTISEQTLIKEGVPVPEYPKEAVRGAPEGGEVGVGSRVRVAAGKGGIGNMQEGTIKSLLPPAANGAKRYQVKLDDGRTIVRQGSAVGFVKAKPAAAKPSPVAPATTAKPAVKVETETKPAEAGKIVGEGEVMVEQAEIDAGNLGKEFWGVINDEIGESFEGTLKAAENRVLIKRFVGTVPDMERNQLLSEAGEITPDAIGRLKRAGLYELFGKEGIKLSGKLLETEEYSKKLAGGIYASMPKLLKAKSLIKEGVLPKEMSFSKPLLDAVNHVHNLLKQGLTPDDYFGQGRLDLGKTTKIDPDVESLGRNLAERSGKHGSVKKIREYLNEFSRLIQGQPNPNEGVLFEGVTSKVQLLDIINKAGETELDLFKIDASKFETSKTALSEFAKSDVGTLSWEDIKGDKTMFDHLVTVGKGYINQGARTIKEFTERLVKEFGEKFRQIAGDLYNHIMKLAPKAATEQMMFEGMFVSREQAAREETASAGVRKVEMPVPEKKGIPKTIKIEGKEWDVDEANFKPVVDKGRRGKGLKLPEEDFVVGRVTSGKKGTNETFVVLNRETGAMVANGKRKTVAINRFNSWLKGYKEEVAKPRRSRQEWNRKLEAERGIPDPLAIASQTIIFWQPAREETAGVVEITEHKGGAAEAVLTEQAGKKKAGKYWYQAMWGEKAAEHPGMDPNKYNLIRNESGRGGSYLVESFDTYGEIMDYVKANEIPQGWEVQYQKQQAAEKSGVKMATAAIKDISRRYVGPKVVVELSEGDVEKLHDGFNEIRAEITYHTGLGEVEEGLNAYRLVDEAGLDVAFEEDASGEFGHIQIRGKTVTPNDSWFLTNRLTTNLARTVKYYGAQGYLKYPSFIDPKTGKKIYVMHLVEDMWAQLSGIEKFCKYQKDNANKRWKPRVYQKIISKYLSNQTGLAEDNGHIWIAANPKAYTETRIKALQDGTKISAKEARQMFIEADAYAKERIRWFSNKYFENNNVRELIEKSKLGVDGVAETLYEKGFRVDDETVNRMVLRPGAKPTVEDHVEAIADEIRLWIEGAKYPESKVQAQLAEVLGAKKEELYPKFEAGWLARKLGINVDDPYIQFATKFRNLREKLTKILVTNPQIPSETRQAIWDNVGYVKRMYHADILKQSFKIDPGKAELARQEMGKHLQHNLAIFVNRIARMPKEWKIDMLKYATNGSQEILDKYGKIPRFIDEATIARDHYMAVKNLAKWDLETDRLGELTGKVEYEANMKAISIASTDLLNHYLSRKRTGGKTKGEVVIHGMPVQHLMKKFLDSPILRDVYGEVLDPVDRSIFTVEAQMHLLVNAAFLNKVWQDNEGVLWSNDSIPRKGLTHHLDNNPYKLGMMAGKYVSRELHDLMTSKNVGPALKWWYRILGMSRIGKLMTPGTLERNFLTSYTGMALLCGDAVDPRYWVEHHKVFITMERAKAGHKLSQDRMVKWAKAGLLGINLQSMSVDAFNAALNTDAFSRLISTAQLKGKTGGELVDWSLDKFREVYNFFDIPAKVASWELQVKLNLKTMDQSVAEKAATEYVRQHYQNALRAARMAGIISKTDVDDFVSFKYDSARIWYNGAENVVKQAKKGNIKPLLGFTVANSILAMSLQKTTAFTYNLLVKGIRKLIDDDDEEGKAFDGLMETEQMNAMKDVSPFWIKKGFLLGWYRKDGSASVVIMDYLLFYPAMTTVAAMLQGRSSKYVLKSTLKDLFGTGMVLEAAFRAYTGQDVEGFRKEEKGLRDIGKAGTVGEAGGIALNRGLEFVNESCNPVGRLTEQAIRYVFTKIKERSGSELSDAQSSKMIFQNTVYPVRIYNLPADRNIKREMWELKHDRDLVHQDIKNSMDLLKKLKGAPLLKEQKKLERSQARMDMLMANVIDKVKSCRTAFPKMDRDGMVEDLVKDTWGKGRGRYLYDGETDMAIRFERSPERFTK